MDEWQRMRADAELDAGIEYAPPASSRGSDPEAILLTGATGFLGAYVLDELLRRTRAGIHCLVRAADGESAGARLRNHLQAHGLWREEAARRVLPVAGDLSRPGLGLAAADYRRLAREVDTVYHNGAWINALLPYADLKAVNVEGTREILRFAGTVRTKPVHYVSTLALFFGAAHARRPLAEAEVPVLDAGLRGGYKQTKWVAEQLVRNAQARGLPAAIYRPGRILGHSRTGVNSNLQDVLCTVLKGCVLLGKTPDVATAIDITPVDHVSRAIVHLSQGRDVHGRAFHLCNPEPIAWNALMARVRELGYPLEGLPYPDWVETLRRQSARHPGESFYRRLRLLLRSPIYLFAKDKPLFSADETQRALAEASLRCPPVDRELVAAYFAYFRRCGYLPEPPAGRRKAPAVDPAGRHQVPDPVQVSEWAAAILRETAEQGMPPAEREALADRLETFREAWARCFERYGRDPAGELSYRDLLLDFETGLAPGVRPWLREGPGARALAGVLSALWPAPRSLSPSPPDPGRLLAERRQAARRRTIECRPPLFERPLFILSAPRSGSTLLFETLAGFPEIWTVGEESHELIEGLPELHPAARGYVSNRLETGDATPAVTLALHQRFARRLRDRAGRAYVDLPEGERPARLRLLEKTPKNALRIPFLRAAFPGARFLVLYRRPEETLASMLDGWRGRRFTAYQPLPGWPHRAWKFLLVPGWENLARRPLAEIVAHQWRMAYETILADLGDLPGDSWLPVRYADLVGDPVGSLRRVAGFAGLTLDPAMERTLTNGLPLSSMTFSAPDPDKWRRHAAALEPVLPGLRDLARHLEGLGLGPYG